MKDWFNYLVCVHRLVIINRYLQNKIKHTHLVCIIIRYGSYYIYLCIAICNIHINKMPLSDSRAILEAPSKRFIGASSAVSETTEKKEKKISKNDIVYVQSRTWPSVDKPGGVARVLKVHEGGNSIKYDVIYVLGGREKQVDEAFVTLKDDINLSLIDEDPDESMLLSVSEDILQWAGLPNPKTPGTPDLLTSASGLFPQEVTVVGCGLSEVNGTYRKEDNGGFPTYTKQGTWKRQVVLYKLTGPQSGGSWFIGYNHAGSDDCLCLYYSNADRNVPPKDGWESYSSAREVEGHTVPRLTYSNPLGLDNLPDEFFKHIATYLTHTSRVLAKKMEANLKKIDLLDIDKRLRMRLTDSNIAGMLVCIDAVNNLEEIRLPHCLNVRGDGLEPLRGSVVLKLVDLSIVSKEVDRLTPKLSMDAVLPILDSILANNQNSIHHIHLPKVWHDNHTERLRNFHLDSFLTHTRINNEDMSQSEKRAKCLVAYENPWNRMGKCKMDCAECNDNFYYVSGKEQYYVTFEGKWLRTCPSCNRKYCDEQHAFDAIKECDACKEVTCDKCNPDFYHCDCCARYLCNECTECLVCCNNDCGADFVENCIDCAERDVWGCHTKLCGRCFHPFCRECEPLMDHLGENICGDCRG